ncbi:MAG: hypothetical protein M3Y87_31925, partial [Myxococcota bacterium]|nr:hypothetical protein [Myxococcota bacterium]
RSPLRASLGLALAPRRAPRFGVRRHYAIAPWSARVEVHWADGCEAYVTPVDHGSVGVAFLYSPPARFDELLARFPHLRERLGGASPCSEDRGAGPFEQRVRSRAVGRILLIGDAAGYLDPITGEGVALGITTARAAIGCLREGRLGAYDARWRRETRLHLGLTAALLDVTRRRSVHRPLMTLLARAPFLFDAALGVLGGQVDPDVTGPRRVPSADAPRVSPASP